MLLMEYLVLFGFDALAFFFILIWLSFSICASFRVLSCLNEAGTYTFLGRNAMLVLLFWVSLLFKPHGEMENIFMFTVQSFSSRLAKIWGLQKFSTLQTTLLHREIAYSVYLHASTLCKLLEDMEIYTPEDKRVFSGGLAKNCNLEKFPICWKAGFYTIFTSGTSITHSDIL